MFNQHFKSEYDALQAVAAEQKLAVVRAPLSCEITERFGIIDFAAYFSDPQQFELLRAGRLSAAQTPLEFAAHLCVLKRNYELGMFSHCTLEPFDPQFVTLSSDLLREHEEQERSFDQLRRDDEDEDEEDY